MKRKYIDVLDMIPFDIKLTKAEVDIRLSGRIVHISGAQWNFRCCDCDLVHNVLIIPSKNKVKILMQRDNRATSQLRRYKKSSEAE